MRAAYKRCLARCRKAAAPRANLSARRGYCRPTGNVRQPDPALPDVVRPPRALRAARQRSCRPYFQRENGPQRQANRPATYARRRGSKLIRFSLSEGCPLVRFSSKAEHRRLDAARDGPSAHGKGLSRLSCTHESSATKF